MAVDEPSDSDDDRDPIARLIMARSRGVHRPSDRKELSRATDEDRTFSTCPRDASDREGSRPSTPCLQ